MLDAGEVSKMQACRGRRYKRGTRMLLTSSFITAGKTRGAAEKIDMWHDYPGQEAR
jgi:GH24 family phage-related lysozyme (muramidase)